ncbi:hypothetical protein Tco_1305605, partial [Tanacetum coccineum]
TMMVQAPEDMDEDSASLIDSHSTPIITQPSSYKPQKKISKRKQTKDSGPTKPIPDETKNEEPISTSKWKGLQRQKGTKRSKNDQKPTRNERDKNKSEETAKDQSWISRYNKKGS